MSTQPNHFARKTTALLSAIAASSLLGLPALAGGLNRDASRVLEQAQMPSNMPSNNNQMQCMSMNQSNSASPNSASNIATPDASAAGAAQLPNQADPRTGIASSDQVVSTDQAVSSRTDGSTATTANNQARDFTASNARSQSSVYGDVLSQGGATSGGFAIQQVIAASNPDAYTTASSRYNSNDPRASYGSRDNATMGNTSSTMNSSASMRSNSTSQPLSQSSRMTTGTMLAQCPAGTMPRSMTPDNRQAPDQLNQGVQTSPQSPQSPDPQMRQSPQSPADDNGSRAR